MPSRRAANKFNPAAVFLFENWRASAHSDWYLAAEFDPPSADLPDRLQQQGADS
jgi:hypothetical protein